MSRFGPLLRRLLERRLQLDDERTSLLLPGAMSALGLSTFLFTVVAQERTQLELALLVSVACCVWPGLRAFLESRDQTTSKLDAAVLEPLPIPPRTLGLARSTAMGLATVITTMNIALPPVVIAWVSYGADVAMGLVVAAALSTWTGLAIGQLLRESVERIIGAGRLEELEGPLRLLVGVSLFGALFAAPSPSAWVEDGAGWAARFPPLSYAFFAAPSGVGVESRWLVGFLGAAASAAIWLLAIRLARSGSGSSKRRRVTRSRLGAWLRKRILEEDERASFDFALANMARDPTFRARAFPLFAFPFFLVFLVANRPDEPHLALLSLYGTGVYLVLAQTFFAYSESAGGPELLSALPMRNRAAFRVGAEKAYLCGLLVPIYAALSLALTLVSTLADAALSPVAALAHAIVAALFAAVVTALLFESQEELAFSRPDRGVYPQDLSKGAFAALILALPMTFLAAKTLPAPWWFATYVVALSLGLRYVFNWKRRKWNRSNADPSPES